MVKLVGKRRCGNRPVRFDEAGTGKRSVAIWPEQPRPSESSKQTGARTAVHRVRGTDQGTLRTATGTVRISSGSSRDFMVAAEERADPPAEQPQGRCDREQPEFQERHSQGLGFNCDTASLPLRVSTRAASDMHDLVPSVRARVGGTVPRAVPPCLFHEQCEPARDQRARTVRRNATSLMPWWKRLPMKMPISIGGNSIAVTISTSRLNSPTAQ